MPFRSKKIDSVPLRVFKLKVSVNVLLYLVPLKGEKNSSHALKTGS